MVPGEDNYRVELRNEIPPCGDVSCNEYAESENGERVHWSQELLNDPEWPRVIVNAAAIGERPRREQASGRIRLEGVAKGE